MERLKKVFRRVVARGCHYWTLPVSDVGVSASRSPQDAAQPEYLGSPVCVCRWVNSDRSRNGRCAGSGKVAHAFGGKKRADAGPLSPGAPPTDKFQEQIPPCQGSFEGAEGARRLMVKLIYFGNAAAMLILIVLQQISGFLL